MLPEFWSLFQIAGIYVFDSGNPALQSVQNIYPFVWWKRSSGSCQFRHQFFQSRECG